MDPVNNLGQVISILRRQMSERSAKLAPQLARTSTAESEAAAAQELRDIQKKIQLRIRALDADDERRHSKAVRIFLEGVLRREFGDTMINDPAFYSLIDDVQLAMESDPGTNESLRGLIRRLCEEEA
ncbi:MAG TPA: hypothetical protein VFB01_04855 [Burkholderiales bacterium]|nr:hypothetical protein [Burkholderiales bacterium]